MNAIWRTTYAYDTILEYLAQMLAVVYQDFGVTHWA
jgi:hypothetical protein